VTRNPLFLTTAIEAVVRAGDLQMTRFGGDFQIDKKGTIDLVTEVDLAVEREADQDRERRHEERHEQGRQRQHQPRFGEVQPARALAVSDGDCRRPETP